MSLKQKQAEKAKELFRMSQGVDKNGQRVRVGDFVSFEGVNSDNTPQHFRMQFEDGVYYLFDIFRNEKTKTHSFEISQSRKI